METQSSPSSSSSCSGCRALRVEVDALKHLLLDMRLQLDSLQGALSQAQAERDKAQAERDKAQAELAKARKNSSNSSKPPSSDIVKDKKRSSRGKRKRKIGGQPGHARHERRFCLGDADEKHTYGLPACPTCAGSQLEALPGAEKTTYQYELVAQPIVLHAHQAQAYWCPDCQQIHYASLPAAVRQGGLVGPNLTAMIGYLKGGCHTSYTTIQSFLTDVMGRPLSTGMLAKVVQKVSDALASPYQEVWKALRNQETLNVDETGHPENGRSLWNWVFRAPDFTVFSIEESRSAQVLEDILGLECEAVLGSDYYAAYRAYMKKAPITVQFCLAHLIREARFLSQSASKVIANYGQRVLDGLKSIFKIIHQREKIPPDRFRRRLEQQRDQFLRMARRTQAGGEAEILAKRFREHGREYFTFITQPNIDPTNNVAEQAIRFCVIDRLITQGTRGGAGRQWCERIWTTLATCAQRGDRAFPFIARAVHAFFSGTPSPSLLATA